MELSVFVDESGDFGEYDYHAPYYIISLVFHNQSNDIQFDLSHFNDELAYLNLSNHCVDSGNLKITNLDRLFFTKNGEFTI